MFKMKPSLECLGLSVGSTFILYLICYLALKNSILKFMYKEHSGTGRYVLVKQ